MEWYKKTQAEIEDFFLVKSAQGLVEKEALQRLAKFGKNTDPEFYQFLSENDRELLEFGSSDSEDDERGGEIHELPKPEELEVGSDESDFEDKESSVKRQGNVITQSMVDKWQQELQDLKYLYLSAR